MKLFDVYPLFDLKPAYGKGAYVYDDKGEEYLDLYGGHAVISIGHSHPHYTKTVYRQLQALPFYSNSIINPLQQELADKLGEHSCLHDYQLFLCNSGAEANENALKLASFANGRTKVITFQRAFHGRTSAAVNITDSKKIIAPINKGFEAEFHALGDLESVAASVRKGDVCAVIIEGIQGIGGIYVPDVAFLEGLQAVCRETETVLILDEIQSGYARSGLFFAFQEANIQPDVISMAKGMGNGFPIGGILIHPRFQAVSGMLGTTFGGNHLACAAGIAVLDVMKEEKLQENARIVGEYLLENLRREEHIVEVRGKGLMIGFDLPFAAGALRKELLFEEKVFTGSAAHPNTVRLLPPLCLSKEQADLFLEKFTKVLHRTIQTQPA